MRELFLRLRSASRRIGLCGNFTISLSCEARSVNLDDAVSKLISQRLAARPQRTLHYPWGAISLDPLPSLLSLPTATRIYSPNMLEYVFGWKSDLPEWDGLCCSFENVREPMIDQVKGSISLAWLNTNDKALKKRTWAPTNLFGDATGQVPLGEVDIVYVAYLEGARADVADLRVEAFRSRFEDWEHRSDIRIPISLLCRLYPRALHEGQPDLIESAVQFCSSLYGEPLLFEEFPATVFTAS